VLGLPGDIRVDKDVPFNRSLPGAMNMSDAAPASARYATDDRIGVLEELLQERYSVRAFLPQPVPRDHRACSHRGAAHGVMATASPAGADCERRGQGRFRKASTPRLPRRQGRP
jgi:hypothetical protein